MRRELLTFALMLAAPAARAQVSDVSADATDRSIAENTPPVLETIYDFNGSPVGFPMQLTMGADGSLYGVTAGMDLIYHVPGSAFRIRPPAQPGGPWIEELLHTFTGDDGISPQAVAMHGGILYGTTYSGGAMGHGTAFTLTPPKSPVGEWIEAVLYSFDYVTGSPNPGLAFGDNGEVYGTTQEFFPALGTVFELTPPAQPGGQWTETSLHEFLGGPNDGAAPQAGVVLGGGILYGTTSAGGTGTGEYCSGGCGTVWAMPLPASTERSPDSPPGLKILYSFQGSPADGNLPRAVLVTDNNGVLYGTTFAGGSATACGGDGCGTAFALQPPSAPGGEWAETVLYNFTDTPHDGSKPSGLVLGPHGVLYGTSDGWSNDAEGACADTAPYAPACGTVFSLQPPAIAGAAWTEAPLHVFTDTASQGRYPMGALAIGRDAEGGPLLYGVTAIGGTSNYGTAYTVSP
jgi:hypothetical protein